MFKVYECSVCGGCYMEPREYVLRTQHGNHTMYMHTLYMSGVVSWKPGQRGARRFPSPKAAFTAMGPCVLGKPRAVSLLKKNPICNVCAPRLVKHQ